MVDEDGRQFHGHAHEGGAGHSHAHGPDGGGAHPGHGVDTSRGFVEDAEVKARWQEPLERGAGANHVLFLQLVSGVAGDMTLAALIDLGVPMSVISETVEALGLVGVELVCRRGYCGAIASSHFDVHFEQQTKERSYHEIVSLISSSSLSAPVQDLALRIFRKLGEAEASVHGAELEQVHFHEVGAIDSIVDIVGVAAAVDYLGARIIASPVPLGRGFVRCRHGVLPLPAPATAHCLIGVPTFDSGLQAELVTPTGAAVVATLAEDFAAWVPMRPIRIGWGAGTRGLSDRPNALRAVLGEPFEGQARATHVLLEANLDDMTGEVAGYALGQVLAAGALDCWIAPITMKKGRPGLLFSALSRLDTASEVADRILRETSTIGVRQTLVSRVELRREIQTIETPLGPVRVKISVGASANERKWKPELDDCIALSDKFKLPLSQVLAQVQAAAFARLDSETS